MTLLIRALRTFSRRGEGTHPPSSSLAPRSGERVPKAGEGHAIRHQQLQSAQFSALGMTGGYNRARLSRNAFPITVTLLSVIAALAIIGLSSPTAAAGTASAL